VESDPEICGVKHRNHCPYCLFSRHVDEHKAGDRRSNCRAAMRPIGLTLKRSHNKYAVDDGELMLIHECLECGKLSINRIAADDNAELLLTVFTRSSEIDTQLLERLDAQGIRLLGMGDLNIVLSRLYGIGESLSQISLASPIKLEVD
jgi:RNHCP domain